MRFQLSIAALLATSAVAAPALAAPVTYQATSAVSDALYAGSNDHSLWMPFFESLSGTPLNGNAEGSDFNFSPAGTFAIAADGAATLAGRIVSQVDPAYSFDVLLQFVGLDGPGAGGPKKELKSSAYSNNGGPIDVATWSYFGLLGGDITGAGAASGLSFSLTAKPKDGTFPGQLGVGANGKNGDLGFSVWFYTVVNDQCTHALCSKIARLGPQAGDVNINLSEVPLPAGVVLFGTGIAALGLRRRRARA